MIKLWSELLGLIFSVKKCLNIPRENDFFEMSTF